MKQYIFSWSHDSPPLLTPEPLQQPAERILQLQELETLKFLWKAIEVVFPLSTFEAKPGDSPLSGVFV